MKGLLKQEDLSYYISNADIIKFISKNAPMDWNRCCDFVRKNNITSDEGPAYWRRKDVLGKNSDEYNSEAIKWMKLFFEAHPFIDSVMIVFDD
jgi:hypothetical protein